MKQEGDLGEYLEAFDSLLARIGVSESMALSFFLSGLKTELEKSVRVHKPQSLQEAVHIARLQEEILKELEKKMQQKREGSLEPKTRFRRSWSVPVNSQRSQSITSLGQNYHTDSTSSLAMANSKGNTSTSISRKEVSDRIAKGLCRLCGDEWDKNHMMKCKVWGKLNAIFSAQ